MPFAMTFQFLIVSAFPATEWTDNYIRAQIVQDPFIIPLPKVITWISA